MNNNLVTVVITTFKREPVLIKRSIDSVLNQSIRNIELIVVDDSPNDYQYRDAVKCYVNGIKSDIPIKYIQHEKNSGACIARNTGIENASGQYIAFLDDDDEWMPTKIEKQLKVFEDCDEQVAIVYCGYYGLYERIGEKRLMTKHYIIDNAYAELFKSNFISSTSIPMFRISLLKNIGGFDSAMPAEQDLDVYLRLCKRYKVACVEEPLVIYYMSENECISANHKKRIQGILRNNNKHFDFLKQNNECYYYRLIMLAREYSEDKNLFKAMELYFTAVAKEPLFIKKNIRYLLILFRDRIWRVRR